MSKFLGLDTSNYSTSVALFDTLSSRMVMVKEFLPVAKGEKGIRQSDAVFHHTKQLPEVLSRLGAKAAELAGIGVSVSPTDEKGSYMPCFTVGQSLGKSLSALLEVPLYECSHQRGHLAAAAYGAGRIDLLLKEFLAVHLSGGTTELLKCSPAAEGEIRTSRLAGSLDLKAGQAVDRLGVRLWMQFPCGKELEELALRSEKRYNPSVRLFGADCSLSGLENQYNRMLSEGERPEDVARFCFDYLGAILRKMTEQAVKNESNKTVLFAGGVMANSIIREAVSSCCDAVFASPEYSSDNGAGAAILAAMKAGELFV